MATINEAGRQGQVYGSLRDGVDYLDTTQEVKFQAYTRVVLPLDGYVFWQPTVQLCIQGSLHVAQDVEQNLDETYGMASVTFTSKTKIVEFSEAPTNTIYVGRIGNTRYAFAHQQGFYATAGIWHYFGHSIPPAMLSSLLDKQGQLDPKQAVVSNSIPLWLALNNYPALYPDFFSNDITLYPAGIVSPNLQAPYGVIDVQETTAIQATPYLDVNRNHWQLVRDRVQITLYGLQNDAAMDFVDCVNQYSVFTENFGIMNMPVVSDPKRTLPELETLAMKKTILYEVDYYQMRSAQIARQLILSAPVTFILN